MADLKISDLGVASATTGSELFPIVQGGITKKITLSNIFETLTGNVGIGVTPAARLDVSVSNVANSVSGIQLSSTNSSGYGNAINFSHSLGGVTSPAVRSRISSEGSPAGSFMRFFTDIGGTIGERMRIDTSGNLGLGVVPSASWFTGSKVIQFGATGAIWNNGSNNTSISQNAIFGNSTTTYINSLEASYYRQLSGSHQWFSAPSGTAGAAISFTQAMTLDASGQLALGTASASATLGRNITLNGAAAGTNTGIVFQSAAVERGVVYGNSTQFVLGSTTAIPTVFTTNNVERARIDSAGNLGLGVVPSAWNSSYKAIDVGNSLALIGSASAADLYFNAYIDSGSTFRYKQNAAAGAYSLALGQHRWYTAPSGTAGAAITFTQAMTLSSSGNLTIGGTNESARVRIEGTTNLSTALQVFRSGNSCGAIWQEASAMRFGTDGSTGFTEKLRVDATTTAGQTALLLWDVDNGTMERVTVGAADSGGTGFKVLRIPN